MTLEQFNSIFLVVGVGILSYFIKNALPAYFTEKGKNLATREDIASITKEVEKVKEEFISRAEGLKTTLQYSNQIKFSVKSEERNALISCYEKYSLWLTLLTTFTLDAGENEFYEPRKVATDIKDAFTQVILAEAKMKLFVGTASLLSINFLKLRIETKPIHDLALKQLATYGIKNGFAKSQAELNLQNDFIAQSKIKSTLFNEIMDLKKEYTEELVKNHEKSIKTEGEWRQLCLERIKDLSL